MTLVVQSVIAIVMFVNQPICLFLFDLQGIDLTSRVIKMYFGVRLIGLGCFYFGAGAIYGLGLITIAFSPTHITNIICFLILRPYTQMIFR